MRHAKSSWKEIGLDDFERPLNKRGKKDAPFMGVRLKKKGVLPDTIISSPAKRAKATAQIIAKEIGFTKPIVYNKNIYEADIGALKKIVTSLKNKNKVVFLFGHNPGLNMLVDNLVGFDENIPTSGIVELEFDCKKWSEISSKNAKYLSIDYPKKGKL